MARVVFAPDSFKGSISAADAATALAAGWRAARSDDEVLLRPMADGGEGTLDAFAAAVPGAERVPVRVDGPDGEPVDAAWLRLPPTPGAPAGSAVVELASTSGIGLLGDRHLPWDADTTGFGQAMAGALDAGVSRLVLGIGSSASTDGGVGMLRALGARFTDRDRRPVWRGARGLRDLAIVSLGALRALPPGGVTVLTDVTNPLLGPTGAAAVFGPQKGLDAEGVAEADSALAHLAALMPGDARAPGSGAAGGTGYALRVWGATLVRGAAEVARLIGLREAVAAASLVVTGEGSFDGQSAAGKAPAHVAAVASETGVPVALVAGRVAADADRAGFAATVSLTELAGSPAAAMADPGHWLRAAGAALATRT